MMARTYADIKRRSPVKRKGGGRYGGGVCVSGGIVVSAVEPRCCRRTLRR